MAHHDNRRRAVLPVTRFFFALITVCVIAAIIIQDHTALLPLGVFNTGGAMLRRIADACLVLAILALIAQVIELATGRLSRICGVVRGVYVSVLILDVLLVFGDRLFVTGNPAGLLGQYYELPSPGGEPVMLKKDFTGATPDPCLADADTIIDGPRILFLGDSYTEGSGRSRECNYPDVVEQVLRESWNENARVINAGVSGYGPVDALNLLRWYTRRGCPVDAVVFNLFLENDFIDNLPGTKRRVVAGIISRFPRSWFLQTFHPLNTRAFRWSLVMVFFGRASTQDMLNAVSVAGGPCELDETPLREVSPFLRAATERGLVNAERIATVPDGRRDSVRAIEEMRAIAGESGVPFILVVFPDRVLVDSELQQLMGITPGRLVPSLSTRAFVNDTFASRGIVLDVSTVLEGRPGMYRTVDTHLSDPGNTVAGQFVGEALCAALSD